MIMNISREILLSGITRLCWRWMSPNCFTYRATTTLDGYYIGPPFSSKHPSFKKLISSELAKEMKEYEYKGTITHSHQSIISLLSKTSLFSPLSFSFSFLLFVSTFCCFLYLFFHNLSLCIYIYIYFNAILKLNQIFILTHKGWFLLLLGLGINYIWIYYFVYFSDERLYYDPNEN